MNVITILTLLVVGLGALAWGLAAFHACLLPVGLPELSNDKDDLEYTSRVFPSREGVLLSTAKGIYQHSLSGNFNKPVTGLDSGKCANIVKVFDTQEGVFVLTGLGPCKSELYRFTAREGLKSVLTAEERQKFVQLDQTLDGVFVFLTDAVYQLEAEKEAPQDLAKVDQCTIHERGSYHGGIQKTPSFIFFPTAAGSLCRLGNRSLDLISGWTNGFLMGAAETSRGVFLWSPTGVYRLDEHNRVGKIAGISEDRVIRHFYETSFDNGLGRVFVGTTNGLFVYSPEGALVHISGDEPGAIHSLHEIRSGLYVLASNGVFYLSGEGKLKRRRKDIRDVKGAGYRTKKGMFFLSFDNQTYQLTDTGEVVLVPLPEQAGKPWDIQDTAVGPLLATDRALYRFSTMNSWILVPSGDFGGGDVTIVPVPSIEGMTTDVPVFIQTQKGVFKWIKSPRDLIKNFRDLTTYKDALNYVKVFWIGCITSVMSAGLVSWVFKHYSLYRYRWVRYYILGLVVPSRVHNQVFISYRRTDTGGHAFNLYEQLCRRFDRALIFFDLDKIEYGEVFPAILHNAVEQCSVLLALIAADWLNARKADGSRRLDDPNDYVRQEIALALARSKTVIPILLGEVSMPEARCLPESLQGLVEHNALRLRSDTYRRDLNQLVQLLAKLPNIPSPKNSKTTP